MSSLFCLPWSRRRSVIQPDTAAISLQTLPPELLLMIALQLPLADAANFALVNRRLSMLIGPTYWPRLRTTAPIPAHRERSLHIFTRDLPSWYCCHSCSNLRADAASTGHREQFLNTLARDLPSWFYCYSCSHLHPLDRSAPLVPRGYSSKELWCSKFNSKGAIYPFGDYAGFFPYYRISFHHLQLVMRRHYLGPGYGISTDDLSFVQVNEFGKSDPRERRTLLFSMEARICTEPARLCLRVQKWTVLHTNVLELAVERAKGVGVCFHHNAEEGEFSQLIISSLNEHLTRSEGARDIMRRTCPRCKLDYQLEILDTDNDNLAIVITRWLDLGSGLTPLDQNWRFHTLGLGGNEIDHAGDAERCRLEFEKEGGLDHHAITLRNASYLSKRQYRKTMNNKSPGVWISQAGRRSKWYERFALW